MKIKIYAFVFIVGLIATTLSCNKKNDYYTNVEVVREWNFNLSSSNQNFVTTGNEVNAAFHMVALADKSIRYDIKIDSISDRIVTAQIRYGDPLSEGNVLIDLPVRIYGGYASGVLTNLAQNVIDALLNNTVDKYITVTTLGSPAGLVRGQLNTEIVFSKKVSLSGASVVPAVTTPTTGTAFLRLAADNKLYSKIVINNNDPADPITSASLNQGIASANGPLVVSLAASAQDFGTAKLTTVSSAISSAIRTGSSYVTASSTNYANGKIRGQVK